MSLAAEVIDLWYMIHLTQVKFWLNLMYSIDDISFSFENLSL